MSLCIIAPNISWRVKESDVLEERNRWKQSVDTPIWKENKNMWNNKSQKEDSKDKRIVHYYPYLKAVKKVYEKYFFQVLFEDSVDLWLKWKKIKKCKFSEKNITHLFPKE